LNAIAGIKDQAIVLCLVLSLKLNHKNLAINFNCLLERRQTPFPLVTLIKDDKIIHHPQHS
jgi:hypothetical protein